MAGQSVRLTAQVQGLGPYFKLKMNLQNMGSKPVNDLEMTFSANPALYTLRLRVLQAGANMRATAAIAPAANASARPA